MLYFHVQMGFVPKDVQKELPAFFQNIHKLLGDELIAVVLYGDLLHESLRTKFGTQMPTNLMLVLSQIDVKALDALVQPVQEGLKKFRLSVMLVTPEDVLRSTDVFPIKFAWIHKQHRLLFGDSPFQQLQIQPDHVRLRTEQEFKNMQLKLRRMYLLHKEHPRRLVGALINALASFFWDLEALYHLHRHESHDTESVPLKTMVDYFELDLSLLETLWDFRYSGKSLEPEQLSRCYLGFLELLAHLSQLADQLELQS